MMNEKIKRWRLILGPSVQDKFGGMGEGFKLDDRGAIMDNALAAIYDETTSSKGGKKSAGLGSSAPNLAKWLTDIRECFPEDVVSVIQSDAIERKGLKQLLLEPETLKNIKPDISMVGTLMSLKGQIPDNAKESARKLIKQVVDDIMNRLQQDVKRAVAGAIHKKNHTPIPSLPGTDWKRTIEKNLKNYDKDRKKVIPERFYFFERTNKTNQWTVILDIDQSGSMADSIIYSSVMSCIFASMPALDTKVVVFDTNVVDLTEACHNDPVDMLFGIQLGGGTDINKSVEYCSQFVKEPAKTLFILISDLYEGGVEAGLIKKLTALYESGVKVLVLVALSDRGIPSYDERLAKKIANIGIPSFGCTPDRLPELIEGALKGFNLMELSKRISQSKK